MRCSGFLGHPVLSMCLPVPEGDQNQGNTVLVNRSLVLPNFEIYVLSFKQKKALVCKHTFLEFQNSVTNEHLFNIVEISGT